jgi:PhnB protein
LRPECGGECGRAAQKPAETGNDRQARPLFLWYPQPKEPAMAVKSIPEGYRSITPYLVVRGADKTIEFLKKAFGAEVVFDPLKRPDGTILHSEVKISDSRVMLSEGTDQHKPMPTMLYLYVPDVDASYRQALAAGGTKMKDPTDEFFGDRTAGVKDPSGNHWEIATHKEDVSPQDLKKRVETMFKQGSKAA